MRAYRCLLVLIGCVSALPQTGRACLWDNDTLRDERRGMPGIAEILAGKWEKHSRYFYEQRIKAMKQHIAINPNDFAAYDNLAVAHEKLGDPDAAIAVMLAKENLQPGAYRTHANLGTFYLHTGDFENGILHIRKAIEINPDAHFGREKYQLQVAVYLQRAKIDPSVFDRGSFVQEMILQEFNRQSATQPATTSIADEQKQSAEKMFFIRMNHRKTANETFDKAITGISGMTRFGTGTSPHLYYALGDLLAARGDKHLAYRAYKLALEFDPPRPALLQEAIEQVTEMVENHADLSEGVIANERADAVAWVDAYQKYEDDLLRAGKNTDDEANYQVFYETHGSGITPIKPARSERLPGTPLQRRIIAVVVGVPIFMSIVFWVVRKMFQPQPERS